MIVKSLVLCILTILVSFESQGGNFLSVYSTPGIEAEYFPGKINSSDFLPKPTPKIYIIHIYSPY